MGLKQRNRIISRGVVVALWVLGVMATPVTSTAQMLYWLPVLALLSFLLVDYFSVLLMALLLTLMVRTIYLDQMPGIARALIIDGIWITAVVAIGLKLLKPASATLVDNRTLLPPSPKHPPPESPLTINTQSGEFPANFRHDLQTPIRLILGFCDAILLADRKHEQGIPPLYRDNVQAIYRNAQQLDKMIADMLNQLPPSSLPDVEEVEPAALIQETHAMLQELITAQRVTLDIKLDDPLPTLTLPRLTIRQLLLNLLRAIARADAPPETETVVTVRANLQPSSLHMTFTALTTRIQNAVTNPDWTLNDRLLETVGGHLRVEAIPDATSDAYSTVVLELPLPTARTNLSTPRPLLSGLLSNTHRTILVVSEEDKVIAFFKKQLRQYEVIGVKDMHALQQMLAQDQPVGIILTRAQHTAQVGTISAAVGNYIPIMTCAIVTAQEVLQRLNIVYLPKPVDYDALSAILTSITPPTEILIVDDNLDSAEMLAQMLASMSVTLVSRKAYLAQDALALLDEQPVGAIILDASLPDMDGITLSQQIRSHACCATVPIVLVSAHQSLEAILPIVVVDKLSVIQVSGFESSQLVAYIDALIHMADCSNSSVQPS